MPCFATYRTNSFAFPLIIGFRFIIPCTLCIQLIVITVTVLHWRRLCVSVSDKRNVTWQI